ncbi:MAG: DUF4912 domain-containing protein [Candidatus Scatovivens sp.]
MPRKAKASEEEKVLVKEKNESLKLKEKKQTKKTAKSDTKKVDKKDLNEKKSNSKTKKSEVKKKTTKKTETKKALDRKKTTKKTETKKSVTKSASKKKSSKTYLSEYYDLPYRYNETTVKILAQTPKRLFVYWDISDKDIKKYKKVFGENFFYDTYPVLLIHNEEMNYTFEVQINDFANCWYVDINDPKCKYTVNLGRKFKDIKNIKIDTEELEKEYIDLKNDYLEIVDSNSLEVPNDHILFEKLGNSVKYRNLKTFEERQKNIESIVTEKGNKLKIYDIYEFYKKIYKSEIDENIFDINNPSSGNTSSKIQFK